MPLFNYRTEFDIHYELYGEGDIKVLFIMGYLTSKKAWDEQVAFFKDPKHSTEICTFDNRGMGFSSQAPGNCTIGLMARDALKLVDFLGWDGVHVVGISMGGMIALELALQASTGRCRSLTLINTHANGLKNTFNVNITATILRGIFSSRRQNERYLALMELAHPKDWLKEKVRHPVSGKWVERSHVLLRKYIQRNRGIPKPSLRTVFVHLGAIVRHYVSSARLQALQESGVPILIITGSRDRMIHTRNSQMLAAKLQSKLIVYDTGGHAVIEQFPFEVNTELRDHFTSNL